MRRRWLRALFDAMALALGGVAAGGLLSGGRGSSGALDAAETTQPGMDQFGGLPVQVTERTGFFRAQRAGRRWVLVTPEGHVFWMRSVYLVAPSGLTFPGKYPDVKTWSVQANRRLKAWGFNALGEYANVNTFPVSTYGGTSSNPEKLPFIRLIRPSQFALDNRWGVADHPVIDLISGVDPIYKIWRAGSFPDVYSPSFEQTVDAIANDRKKGTWVPIFPQGLATSPWLIGTSTDDADYLYGFKRGWTEHLGWMIAVANPTRTSGAVGSISKTVTYTDPRFYTKEAWRDRLIAKYGTIAALNVAWGASYTTFGSDGGWPLGKGLMDESGRNSWMQPISGWLGVSNPVIQAELDAMMEQVADKYFSLMAKYIRQFTPNHLVFGPSPLHDSKPQILRAAARHVDVLQSIVSPGNLATLESFLDRTTPHFPKPIFLWTTFTSQANSPFAGKPNNWGEYDKPTQEERGKGYSDYLGRVMAYTTQAGVKPIVGIDWWSWPDNPGEGTNFGLVTLKDNAYDGWEAVIPQGIDRWGYLTGGEINNYGDFLDAAIQAHSNVFTILSAGTPPPPMSVAITSPGNGSVVSSTVSVAAQASGSVTRLELSLDGVLMGIFSQSPATFAWDTTQASNSSHSWFARAYDPSGSVASSSPVTVTVSNNNADVTAPSVAISSPANGASVPRVSRLGIVATASDNVGVVKVEFYVDGKLKCTVPVAPYTCSWQIPGSSGKTYKFHAKAYDQAGNSSLSSPVQVTSR